MDVKKLFDLTGRAAVVTGGGSGLGRQLAEALAEAGASLVLCARRKERCEQTAQELQKHGVQTLALGCDVTNPEDIQQVVEQTLKEFGEIDILINNAGIAWGAPAEEMKLEDWNKVLETNLTGTFLFSQAAGKAMIKQQQGKIINIASVAGLGGAPAEILDAVGYHASKGAVITLTKDLACKWARHNIQVNAIAPGWFPSDMANPLLEHRGEKILAGIPLGRFGGEDDLKGAAVLLASRASSYITGHVLVVDGGQTAW